MENVQRPPKRRRRRTLIVAGVILFLAGVLTIVMFNGGCGMDLKYLSPKEEAVLLSQTQPGLEWPKSQNPRVINVSGKTEVIPMSHFFDNFFICPEINGKKLMFALDTGAWHCFLDPYVAIDCKIPVVPGGLYNEIGVNGEQGGGFAGIVPNMKLGNMEILDTPMLIPKMSTGFQILGIRFGRTDGYFGNSFFCSFVCTFDAKEEKLTLRRQWAFDPARDLPNLIDSIPFKLDELGHIALNVRVAGRNCNAKLDFAASGQLMLPLKFAQELNLPFKGKTERTGTTGRCLAPTGGPVMVELGKEQTSVEFCCPPGIKDFAVICIDFFRLYRLTIDYLNKIIYVESRQK